MSEQPDEHPLFLELRATRAALARSQEDVHATTVKLQRFSLDTSRTHERAVSLQRENEILKEELAVLRTTPLSADSFFASQAHVQELTLSLRKLSHKLTLTEEALLAKSAALISAQADLKKASIAEEVAYELCRKLQSREEVERVKVKKLELKVTQLEEAVRMSEVALAEYAKLVRDMEARPISFDKPVQPSKEHAGDANIISALFDGRFTLQRLVENFRVQYEELYRKLGSLQGELEVAQSRLEVEERGEKANLAECARMKTDLDKLRIDDETAAKLVARYMQFSQSSTNSLSESLEALKARHNATVSTLSSQNYILNSQISALNSQNEHLRNILDDLGAETMKEKFGRRREISLRIRMGGREERVVEGLRRWVRRGEEAVGRFERKRVDEDGQAAYLDIKSSLVAMSQDARILLESLEEGGADEETALSLSGARAREILVRDGVEGLLDELRIETERRILQQLKPMFVEENVSASESHSRQEAENNSIIPHSPSHSLEIREEHQHGGQLNGNADVTLLSPAESEASVLSANGRHSEVDLSSGSHSVSSQCQDVSLLSVALDLSETQTIDVNQGLENVTATSLGNPFGETHSTIGPLSPDNTANVATGTIFLNGGTEDITSVTAEIPCQSEVNETPSMSALSSNASLSKLFVPSTPPREHLCETLGLESTSSETADPFSFPDSLQRTESKTHEELLPHPLLTELAEVHKRYDAFQHAFKNCHLALEGLKADLASYQSPTSSHAGQQNNSRSIPADVLRTAVSRLDDFTEDVRVELEIRIGDEVLHAKGYEALLRVPGALHSSSSHQSAQTKALTTAIKDESDTDASVSYTAVEKQVEAFLNGTDPSVRKAKETFARKLEDVQHDIAALKRALHDPESFSEGHSPSSSTTNLSPSKTEIGFDSERGQGGGWATWITGSASRSTTPTPSLGPSQTFGNIMTSPRLKYPSSSSSEQQFNTGDPRSSGKTSVLSSLGVVKGKGQPKDPLGLLGLKVPMPSFTMDSYSSEGRYGNGFSSTPMSATFGGIMSPSYPSMIGPAPIGASKSRTLSTMYMFGLGAPKSSRGSGDIGAGGKLMRSVSAKYPESVKDKTFESESPFRWSQQSTSDINTNSLNSLETDKDHTGDNDIE